MMVDKNIELEESKEDIEWILKKIKEDEENN